MQINDKVEVKPAVQASLLLALRVLHIELYIVHHILFCIFYKTKAQHEHLSDKPRLKLTVRSLNSSRYFALSVKIKMILIQYVLLQCVV